jgi:hypothetical protein
MISLPSPNCLQGVEKARSAREIQGIPVAAAHKNKPACPQKDTPA